VFGFSLGEIMLLLIVGIVVVGPKKLPTLMRTTGQWIGKLRRMSTDLRSQSGIDDLIRKEGLEREIQELRSLARMNVMGSLMSPALNLAGPERPLSAPISSGAPPSSAKDTAEWKRIEPLREREYPLIGCDACGALADDAVIYVPEPAAPLNDVPEPAEPLDAAAPPPEGASLPPAAAATQPSSAALEGSAPLSPKAAGALAPLVAPEGSQERSPS
jgi:sec-independent protein translocase protein TatB